MQITTFQCKSLIKCSHTAMQYFFYLKQQTFVTRPVKKVDSFISCKRGPHERAIGFQKSLLDGDL
jgi:hypothetical protein